MLKFTEYHFYQKHTILSVHLCALYACVLFSKSESKKVLDGVDFDERLQFDIVTEEGSRICVCTPLWNVCVMKCAD